MSTQRLEERAEAHPPTYLNDPRRRNSSLHVDDSALLPNRAANPEEEGEGGVVIMGGVVFLLKSISAFFV